MFTEHAESIRRAGFAWTVVTCFSCAIPAIGADVPSTEKTILAFGNSLTAGQGVAADEAYPARLERRLRDQHYAYRVINAGVSGDTTTGGLRRVEWALQSQPDIVIVELGANDGLRGLSTELIRKNLAQIIERFQAAGTRVILAGMRVPPNYGEAYSHAFADLFPHLAAQYHVPLIPFFLDGVAGVGALNQTDGVHPTAEGYRVIVDQLWPVVRSMLDTTKPTQRR